MQVSFQVEYNKVYTDTVSGFTGKCIGISAYSTGCSQILLAAKVKDEFSEPVSKWFDESRRYFAKIISI